jgi:hypothetical protein
MPAQLWELWFATPHSATARFVVADQFLPGANSARGDERCPRKRLSFYGRNYNAVALVLEIRDHGISHKFAYSGSPARRSPSWYRAIFSACR